METINIKAHSVDSHQIDAIKAFMKALKIKFEVAKDSPYDAEFVKKVENSRKQADEGNTVKIDLDDIWK
jgi:cytochrome c